MDASPDPTHAPRATSPSILGGLSPSSPVPLRSQSMDEFAIRSDGAAPSVSRARRGSGWRYLPPTREELIRERQEIERARSKAAAQAKKKHTAVPRLERRASVIDRIIRVHAQEQTKSEDYDKHKLLWELMSSYLSTEVRDIQQFICNHLEYTQALSRFNFTSHSAYMATAYSVRDRLIEFYNDTQELFAEENPKRAYYLSIEYLMGRSLRNALLNLKLEGRYAEALRGLGYALEDIYEEEQDPGLGNGGLGRLAACFMDSLATMDYPAFGYGIRYHYGMFTQHIHNGYQVETPDYWLQTNNPWEIQIARKYNVPFGGYSHEVRGRNGLMKWEWVGAYHVVAVAYDTPIPGYSTLNTLALRLWTSRPSTEFELSQFNRGDYYGAIAERQQAEKIASVLYPNDTTREGKMLRLQQQFFFCCATLQDIVADFKSLNPNMSIRDLPKKVAIQLNDTHPTISVVELMRLMLDEEELSWEAAWGAVVNTFAYTNHTVLPEALETWPVAMFQELLPRHLQIVYEINRRFLEEVKQRWPDDDDRIAKLSIFNEYGTVIKMANLAIVGSHCVNGVAALHTDILKREVFKDFYDMWPEKFQNKTNGVTPRRWVLESNPRLSTLITEVLTSDAWLTDTSRLAALANFADDRSFQRRWMACKQHNKRMLQKYIADHLDVDVPVDALYDIQVKRIHEYKRQLLNILGVIARYLWIKKLSEEEKAKVVRRVVIFGGKAAAAYERAKLIIKLIHSVADVVNSDPSVGDLLKVVFIPNYCVSLAEKIVPASDISQHISTAGTEASGTSNMKFVMNGGLILGTLDGANIEIREEVGEDNMFIFGALAEDVPRHRSASPGKIDSRLYNVLRAIELGMFGPAELFRSLIESLWSHTDYYLIAVDFPSYMDAHDAIDAAYKDKVRWAKMSIMATAGSGKFSSDRTIRQYAEEIWGISKCRVPELDPDAPVNVAH